MSDDGDACSRRDPGRRRQPPTRYSTARVLRNAGFTVLEAATGQDALRLAAEPVDLVVLDVNLPDIDGFEVCRRLRASPPTARTPVIHLSATFVNDVDKVQGLDAGADGYITHPVEPPVLVATVNAFLRARRAEDALRESEAKFKAVFDQALNGIALLSHDMIFLEVNPAMCATFGRDRANVVGKHISAFNAGGSEHRVEEITAALAATGAWRGTLPVLHADGRHVELDWSVSIHSGPGIRLAITTDVTDRREIEAERERLLASETAARAEAERANQVKDDFLAALSHELRTPLNAIVGWSQLLKQRVAGGDADVVAGINAIERNARVQAQLIADLLDVSRVASGKLQIERQWFDPAEEIAAAIENVQPAARARDIAVDVTLEGQREPLLWDPARFQQVVWNLLDNAVKFSPEGGRVAVRLLQTESDLELVGRRPGPRHLARTSCRTSSSRSARSTPAPSAGTAASGSGSRSSVTSSRRTTAASPRRAPAISTARRSSCGCRGRSGTAEPAPAGAGARHAVAQPRRRPRPRGRGRLRRAHPDSAHARGRRRAGHRHLRRRRRDRVHRRGAAGHRRQRHRTPPPGRLRPDPAHPRALPRRRAAGHRPHRLRPRRRIAARPSTPATRRICSKPVDPRQLADRRRRPGAGRAPPHRPDADGPPMAHIPALTPIAVMRSTLRSLEDAPRQGDEGAPDAWLEVDPAFARGLTGLRAGDAVLLITLARSRRSRRARDASAQRSVAAARSACSPRGRRTGRTRWACTASRSAPSTARACASGRSRPSTARRSST